MKKSDKKSDPRKRDSPSRLIDARIKELGDWRGETLSRIRTLIKQADPEVVEEWKWRLGDKPHLGRAAKLARSVTGKPSRAFWVALRAVFRGLRVAFSEDDARRSRNLTGDNRKASRNKDRPNPAAKDLGGRRRCAFGRGAANPRLGREKI